VEKPGAEVSVKVTYKDYLEFPDDGRRYEVIDGEVVVTPAPNLRTSACSRTCNSW